MDIMEIRNRIYDILNAFDKLGDATATINDFRELLTMVDDNKIDICPQCGTILNNYIDILGERVHISHINPEFLRLFDGYNRDD